MIFDVIMPVCSKTQQLIRTTLQTIDSLSNSETENIKFNLLVIESGDYFDYTAINPNISMISYSNVGRFNYNHALNIGLKHTRNKYILLINNDITFHAGFINKLMRGFQLGYLSLSPRTLYNDKVCVIPEKKEGYLVGQHIHGCCIAMDRDILKQINKLDEACDFWYSDHVYAEQLKDHNIKHRLMPDAVITHLESQTLNELTADEYFDQTVAQLHNFKKYTGEL